MFPYVHCYVPFGSKKNMYDLQNPQSSFSDPDSVVSLLNPIASQLIVSQLSLPVGSIYPIFNP